MISYNSFSFKAFVTSEFFVTLLIHAAKYIAVSKFLTLVLTIGGIIGKGRSYYGPHLDCGRSRIPV